MSQSINYISLFDSTQVRGKLIGALGKCSGKLGNFDQVGTIVGVMGKVTAVKDEVSTDSKVRLPCLTLQQSYQTSNCAGNTIIIHQ